MGNALNLIFSIIVRFLVLTVLFPAAILLGLPLITVFAVEAALGLRMVSLTDMVLNKLGENCDESA